MKNRIKKTITILIVSIVLVLAPVVNVFAERVSPNVSDTVIRNTLETLTTEARAAHAGHVFYDCTVLSHRLYPGTTVKGKNLTKDGKINNFYAGSGTPGGTRGVGAWLEKKVGGEVEDGAIWCDEDGVKLMEVFAQQIGVSKKDLLCGAGNTPGLFRNENKKGECDLGSSSNHGWNPNWSSFIGGLYDKYAEEHNWKYRWSDVGNDGWEYPSVIGYSMYVAEVTEGCGKSAGATKPSVGYITTALNFVNEKAEVTDDWYYGEDGDHVVPKTANGKHHAFVAKANNATCKDMIGYANKKSGDFKKEIEQLIKDGCKAAYEAQYNKAKDSIENGSSNDKLTAAVAEYEAMLAANDFTDDTDNGGLECKDTENLASVTQAAWDDTDSEEEVTCFTAGASLGWILCPILDQLTSTVNSIYDSVIAPYLKMNVNIIDPNSTVGVATFTGWQTFQTIANVILVLFFLIIIFSQLTGVGIDNYNIKKSLPKIITAAILINLSYILCEVAVDISNITGAGIKSLFDGLVGDVTITNVEYNGTSNAVSNGAAAITGGFGVLAVLVGAVTLYTNGAAVLVPLVIGAISVAVSIFFAFILLSIRKAAVVILIVISPVAFAMYMLPNTKKIFDKWFKAFQGILLLYPICGALIGGGNYVSKLLLSTGGGSADFFFAISAMIIGVVPVFFIPSLLKQSFAAMGNIGARISGIGKMAKGKATGMTRRGIENSRVGDMLNARKRYVAHTREQKHAARQGEYNVRKARGTLKRMGDKNIAAMSSTERAKYQTATGMVNAENKRMQDVYSSRFMSLSDGDINDQLEAMGNSGKMDANMAVAAISSYTNKGDAIAAVAKLSESEAWNKMSADDRSMITGALVSDKSNAVLSSYGKLLGANPKNKDGIGGISLSEAISGSYTNAEGVSVKLSGGSIESKIKGMSEDTMVNQDKDVLEYMANNDMADMFNQAQVGQFISKSDGHSSHSQQGQKVLARRTDLADDIASLTDEQFSGVKSETIDGARKIRTEIRTRDTSIDEKMTDSDLMIEKTVERKAKSTYANENLRGSMDAKHTTIAKS